MAPKGKKKGKVPKPIVKYDSDDERAYRNEKVPDPEDSDYFNDDIDDFHNQKEKILLDKGVRALEPADFSSDDKESVLGLGDNDSSDDEEVADYKQRLKQLRRHGVKEGHRSDSDEEEKKAGDGLPNEKAWGKKRKGYYWGDDASDDDDFEADDNEPGAAELEEKEALKLQKQMAEQLDDTDFGLGIFEAVKKPMSVDKSETSEKIETDVSHLSHRAKLDLLKKESPELLDLIADYKAKMTEVHTRWLPLLELAKASRLPPSMGTKYISTKVQLGLNYCVNVSFYLMLKARHTPQLHSHPIINRLVQYRKMMKQMEVADRQVAAEVDELLAKVKGGEEIELMDDKRQPSVNSKLLHKAKKKEQRKRREAAGHVDDSESESEQVKDASAEQGGRSWGRKRKVDDGLTAGEREAMEFYDAIKSGKKKRGLAEQIEQENEDVVAEAEPSGDTFGVEEEELEGGKREVTYQILKNKGLQAPKKKEHRNPRVKYRLKARKQKIRRKGQVREVRTETTRYGGELSGIRAGIKRSTKFR